VEVWELELELELKLKEKEKEKEKEKRVDTRFRISPGKSTKLARGVREGSVIRSES
jgi:hypothetical protein